MKKITLLLAFAAMLIGASSCTKKCQTCSNVYGSTIDMTYCEQDFPSKEEYKLGIQLVEAAGAKCK